MLEQIPAIICTTRWIILKVGEKEPVKELSYFVILCCEILTMETSHLFLRSFCLIGQNGMFSTTEQNGIIFLLALL